jgi:hypothetical protein
MFLRIYISSSSVSPKFHFPESQSWKYVEMRFGKIEIRGNVTRENEIRGNITRKKGVLGNETQGYEISGKRDLGN